MISSNKCQSCQERFSVSYKPIGFYAECGHLNHATLECLTTHCVQCDGKYSGPLLNSQTINSASIKNYQNHINITSIKRNPVKLTWFDRFNGVWRLCKSLPVLIGLYWRLAFGTFDMEYLFWLNNWLLKLLNINVYYSQKSQKRLTDSSYKRVVICNHTNYHDLLVVGSLLSPKNFFGFVASNQINKLSFGRAITQIVPNIILENKLAGESNYERIREYWTKYPHESRLMICPEGMLTHSKTICRFRSTAFKLGYPVQPVVIKYKQNIFDLLDWDIWCYPAIDAEVIVLEPVDTDGSDKSIESIRQLMARVGDFTLSNVINR